MSIVSRVFNVFRQERLNREIDEELASHIAEAIDEGRDPAEARRVLGSPLRLREASRDVRLVTWLESLRADIVFGFRQLRKNRAASAATILSLALTMGACISAFRLVDALLLRPLPVAAPERLFLLTYPTTNVEGQAETGDTFDYPQYRALRSAVECDAELLAITRANRNGLTFTSDANTERFWRQLVSGRMFAAFGLKPALGRLLAAGDDVTPGAHPVAVLSYDYWSRRFARDPSVIGRRFRMGTDLYEIVGVADPRFTGTEPGSITDVFVPTMMNAKAIDNPTWGWVRIWVQLKPGARPDVVRQKLRAAVAAWRAERAKTWPADAPRQQVAEYLNADVRLEPAAAGFSRLQNEYRRPLAALGIVVTLVLLIACANVAGVMTAQAVARSREMAMRVASGAGRWRLVQLVLMESALVAFLASALGVVFAWWSAPMVVSRLTSSDNPVQLVLQADWRLIGFAGGLALAVMLLFGLIPALRASSLPAMNVLRGGYPHTRRRVLNGLIVAQVAFCVLVQLVAGLFMTTFDRLSRQPTGFVADGLMAVETVTRNNEPQPYVFWQQVGEHLQAIDGVESVALSGWALLSGNTWTDNVTVSGQPQEADEVYFLAVSPGWLKTMGIRLLDGRDLAEQDTYSAAAIVNESFARRYLRGAQPVGRTLETQSGDEHVRTMIVGSVADARYLNMRESIRPTVYVPFRDRARGMDWATFVVRAKPGAGKSVAAVLRREVTRARPEFRVVGLRTQTDLVEQHMIRERLLATLSLFFGGVALLLAGLGVYGALHQWVLRQRRDIAIRLALGASVRSVVALATAGMLAMLALGSGMGLAAGLASERYFDGLLYHVKATDWPMLAFPVAAILVVAVCAALPPVARALRINPATVLKAE
jgi:putative ABC transport system permease protein